MKWTTGGASIQWAEVIPDLKIWAKVQKTVNRKQFFGSFIYLPYEGDGLTALLFTTGVFDKEEDCKKCMEATTLRILGEAICEMAAAPPAEKKVRG